jgi:FtsH-binding integral membrane protein
MFSWHYQAFPLSLILMVIILICLYSILRILREQNLRGKRYFFIQLPFSIYFGWITVATIANTTTLLVSLGWNGFGLGEPIWTIVILLVGMAIGIATSVVNKDLPYDLVLIWAYLGILLKHTSTGGFAKSYQSIIVTVYICLALFVACALYLFVTRNKQKTVTA